MAHALVRTNEKGVAFIGRCIKCGREGLAMSEGMKDCPQDELETDESALLRVLGNETSQ